MHLPRLFPLLLLLLCSTAVTGATGDKSLFVNLTSDETDRAVMAIALATRVQTEGQHPVTIFLNVDAVKLAHTAMPQIKHSNGRTAQEMLSTFMNGGGRVIICPMCMDNLGGFTGKDLLEGVELGGPTITIPAMMSGDTTVLSY